MAMFICLVFFPVFLDDRVDLLCRMEIVRIVSVPENRGMRCRGRHDSNSCNSSNVGRYCPKSCFRLLCLPASFLLLCSRSMPRSRGHVGRFHLRVFVCLVSRVICMSVCRVNINVRILIPRVFRRHGTQRGNTLIYRGMLWGTMLLCNRIGNRLSPLNAANVAIRCGVITNRLRYQTFFTPTRRYFSANFRLLGAREFCRVVVYSNVRSLCSVFNDAWYHRRSSKNLVPFSLTVLPT